MTLTASWPDVEQQLAWEAPGKRITSQEQLQRCVSASCSSLLLRY